MGHNEITGDNSDVECEEDNQPLIEDNESQSYFWFRLLLLCKKRWKLLLSVLFALVIGTSILIGYTYNKGMQSKKIEVQASFSSINGTSTQLANACCLWV